MKPKVGDKAPGFTLNDKDGKKVSLSDFKGKTVVLYFYPKDDTSGCTTEACSFRDNMPKFKNMVILGVSMDNEESHQKFAAKYNLPFTLLSDVKGEVVKKYDVYGEKSMYGKKYMGIFRTTFIIGKDGKIMKVFENVKPDQHVEEVLQATK